MFCSLAYCSVTVSLLLWFCVPLMWSVAYKGMSLSIWHSYFIVGRFQVQSLHLRFIMAWVVLCLSRQMLWWYLKEAMKSSFPTQYLQILIYFLWHIHFLMTSRNKVSPTLSAFPELFLLSFLPNLASFCMTASLTLLSYLVLDLPLENFPISFIFKTFSGVLSLFILKNSYAIWFCYLLFFEVTFLYILFWFVHFLFCIFFSVTQFPEILYITCYAEEISLN